MALANQCVICWDCFDQSEVEEVACGSPVKHLICFKCELKNREQTPLTGGVSIMECPICRKKEKFRSIESLLREAAAKQVGGQAEMADARAFVRNVRPREERTPSSSSSSSSASSSTSVLINYYTEEEDRLEDAERIPPKTGPCASGRPCPQPRVRTHTNCIRCNVVFCCSNCRECVGCNPTIEID